jgi:hypothetical protein
LSTSFEYLLEHVQEELEATLQLANWQQKLGGEEFTIIPSVPWTQKV